MGINNNFHSAIMVPGDNQRLLDKVGSLGADLYVLNLEDAVASQNKEKALKLVCEKLSATTFHENISVRVNELNSGGIEEIKTLNGYKPKAIRVPKIETLEEVEKIVSLVDKEIEIHLTIETAFALENLKKFNINNQITTVFLGILDMLESLKIPQKHLTRDNPLIQYILSKFLFDSKMIGMKPFSFVYQEYQNLDEFQKWVEFEKSIGYDAKTCITPKQVEIVNMMYKIDSKEIERAKIIKNLFEENSAKGVNGFVHEDYGFIDEPIYKDALVTLNLD